MASSFEINPAGFTIHSAVHEARDDAHCVIHLHTIEGVAVSCQKDGLLPISQQSLYPLMGLAYHDYEGVALNPEEKARLVRSDLFDALDGRKYDLIVSNPPYVKASSMARLPEEYRKEPGMALASGTDGLDHTRVILREAKRHLNRGGTLIVEIGRNRKALEKAYPKLPFRWPKTSAGTGFVFELSREELP